MRDALYHDPSAALLVDGHVVAAAEEERFSRRKHGKRPVPFAARELPEQAMVWCRRAGSLAPADLDAVAYSFDPALAKPGRPVGAVLRAAEFADHGRPYGGRARGEGARQPARPDYGGVRARRGENPAAADERRPRPLRVRVRSRRGGGARMTRVSDEAAVEPTGRWLTPGVASVGLASFFSDASHEQVTSLLPSFLTSTLHAGPAALGVIEGASDALTGLSKLAGGPLAAERERRGRLASGGYLVTAAATAAIGLTTAVWQVAILRAFAWAARGIRSPARDTLLMSLAPPRAYGRASGVERAGDNLGALVGPLLASVLVAAVGVRHAMLWSVVPGLLAVAAITVAAREARRTLAAPGARRQLSFNLRELRAAGLARVLVPVACFEVGNLATTFLILRATTQLEAAGRSATAATSLAILMYAGHNAAATVASLWGGSMADRRGPRPVLIAGAGVYVVAYLLFGLGPSGWVVPLLGFLLAGVGIGMAETSESTFVARQLPDRLRGNGYGLLGLTQATGDLGASLVAGVLWAAGSASLAFGYAAAWMAAAAVLAITLRPGSPGTAPEG